MSMTVKQLIAELNKYPQTAKIAIRNHDQSLDEIDGQPCCVEEATDEIKAQHGVKVIIQL